MTKDFGMIGKLCVFARDMKEVHKKSSSIIKTLNFFVIFESDILKHKKRLKLNKNEWK